MRLVLFSVAGLSGPAAVADLSSQAGHSPSRIESQGVRKKNSTRSQRWQTDCFYAGGIAHEQDQDRSSGRLSGVGAGAAALALRMPLLVAHRCALSHRWGPDGKR